jgi:hypothetical protein
MIPTKKHKGFQDRVILKAPFCIRVLGLEGAGLAISIKK